MSETLFFSDVHFSYGHRAILKGIDFTLAPSDSTGLLGVSGSGKSTLGRLALGLEQPSHGRVSYGNSAMPNPRVAMVFQDSYHAFHPAWTALEVLDEHARLMGLRHKELRADRIRRSLDFAGFPQGQLNQQARRLSGGQRQRLAIARALVQKPEVLILDEPTANLDPSVESRVLDTLACLHRENAMALLCISHDIELVRFLCSRVLVLQDGQLSGMFPSNDTGLMDALRRAGIVPGGA